MKYICVLNITNHKTITGHNYYLTYFIYLSIYIHIRVYKLVILKSQPLFTSSTNYLIKKCTILFTHLYS